LSPTVHSTLYASATSSGRNYELEKPLETPKNL